MARHDLVPRETAEVLSGPGLVAHVVNRSVRQLGKALASDVLGVGGAVETQPGALHGWCPGEPQDEVEHVDVVRAQLQPQTLGEMRWKAFAAA